MFYVFYLQCHDFFGIKGMSCLYCWLFTLLLVSWWDFAATALNFMEVRIESWNQDMWWWYNVAKLETASKTSLETDCVQHVWVLKDWIFLELNITGSLEMWTLKWAAPELRFSMRYARYLCNRLPACLEYVPQEEIQTALHWQRVMTLKTTSNQIQSNQFYLSSPNSQSHCFSGLYNLYSERHPQSWDPQAIKTEQLN